MANIKFMQNLGSIIVVGGNAYRLVGSTNGGPTNPSSDLQVQGITDITHNSADAQGKNYYTAEEQAIAMYEFGGGSGNPIASNNNYWITIVLRTTDPTVNDDNTVKFVSSSRWVNCTTGKVFKCTSAATGAAVWVWQNTAGTLRPCPTGGVLRTWSGDGQYGYVNGISYGRHQGNASTISSRVINLAVGDTATTGSASFSSSTGLTFLPFQHG